ncbi:hypothetical protein E7811_16120 [Aliigemmobacter aestuarii]|uniref:SGNH/GDSL hydrolase family protein n=1 Tax=Aliigemmobacter aestuarii TaxID=1445661 RepID=A0A4S3ML47_9RHOB|nr:hypothetical protein [Gemmobacter aestuarii]THD81444.1 hypothetical protein E7811_16120 [Gemmobacter aestuarii]
MLPDVIILGDSHSNALMEGCEAHGLKAEMIRFSGNLWHGRRIVVHPEHGVWISKPKALQRQILDLRQKLGGRSILSPDVPVIGSFGFHLGRFAPMFGLQGHVTQRSEFEADPESLFVSSAYVREYVTGLRTSHVRLARHFDQQTNLVMVAPPFASNQPNMRTFYDFMLDWMRAVGLRVYDPNADLVKAGMALDPSYLLDDGRHGNGRYGAEVIGNMIAQGLIRRAA